MRLRCALSALALLAAVSACGGSDEPAAIRTGSLPAPTDKVAVAAPGSGGFTAFDKWPRGCALLTEADLRAGFPGITRIEQESASYQIDVSDRAFGQPVRETVVDGTCNYRFWFDGAETAENADVRGSRMSVVVLLAGAEDIVDLNYKPGKVGSAAHPMVPGAQECRTGSQDIECKLPNVAFKVTESIMLYGGLRFDKQPDGRSATQYVKDELLPAYANVVAERLS